MKKLLLAVWAAFALAGPAAAAGDGVAWDRFPTEKLNDLAALQNGARLFANYCLNCHSASYVRYNRLKDIGLTDEQIKSNLMFASEKVGETMKSAITAKDAKDWFGGVPPDLSLVARSRAAVGQGSGPDYLYTFLRTFYRDDTKATGWNNLAFPNAGMPHVLWDRQGPRELTVVEVRETKDASGKRTGWEEVRTLHAADGATTRTAKPLTEFHGHASSTFDFAAKDAAQAARYDAEVADLVAFLQWMADPSQKRRVQVGAWVLLFIGLLIVVTWRLSAAYWKDIK